MSYMKEYIIEQAEKYENEHFTEKTEETWEASMLAVTGGDTCSE